MSDITLAKTLALRGIDCEISHLMVIYLLSYSQNLKNIYFVL